MIFEIQDDLIFLNGDKGCVEKWIQPGEGIVVPDSWVSEQVTTMAKKRILVVSNA